MDLLVADALEADVVEWLDARHRVRHAPELAHDPREFRRALYNVRTAIVAPSLAVDLETLDFAPVLRAIGRVNAGLEGIDIEACERRRIEVIRSLTASGRAEAEFMVGAALSLLRLVPLRGSDGSVAGRELGGAMVGLLGMSPTARVIARLLSGFGARLHGYDPQLHASDPAWSLWDATPLSLRELIERSDVLFVQLGDFVRYHGLLGDRLLPHAKPGQVIVSISSASLFDETALAASLRSGRVAAAWLDGADASLLEPPRPLAGIPTLRLSQRLAGATREARQRSAWAVARRIDELLDGWSPNSAGEFRESVPGDADAPDSRDFTTTVPGALAGL